MRAIKRRPSKGAKGEAYPNPSLPKAFEKSVKKVISTTHSPQGKPEMTGDEGNRLRNLEVVGMLTGGIAHDFNNALTAIMHNVYAAKMFLNNDAKRDEVPKLLDACMKTIRRSTDLTGKLLAFSSGGNHGRKSTYLKNVIKDSVEFSLSGSNVGCDLHIPKDLWPTTVDEVQIEQAISNLVINAKQAKPAGGTIEVSAANVVLRDDDGLPLRNGRYVRISINEMGSKIPAKYLEEIFDPNFKSRRKDNGLSLSDAYLVIRNNGGHIDAESEASSGVTFNVYLPASEVAPEPGFHGDGSVTRGKVLVMDNEEDVRSSMLATLALLGYKAECAEDGDVAIKAYKEAMKSAQPFDAVLMDLTVPGGMGGVEAVKELKTIDPDVKVVISSGYPDDPVMANFEKYGFWAAVKKPHSVEGLNNLLSRIISSKRIRREDQA